MTLTHAVLPSEVMLMIFSILPSSDIQNLRLVNWEYHNFASQYLIRTLRIASDPRSLQLWKRVSTDNLFRRRISRVVYHTGPTHIRPPLIEGCLHQRRGLNTSTRFGLEVEHIYDIYDVLRAGLSLLPMVGEVMITDQYSPIQLEAISTVEWDLNQWRSQLKSIEDEELTVFMFLRTLAEAKLRLRCFDLHVARFIPDSTQCSRNHEASSKQSLLTFHFQNSVIAAAEVFKNLRELSISTCGPVPQSSNSYCSKTFEENLMALLLAAGAGLENLQLAVRDMPMPSEDPSHILFSGQLLKASRTSWPLLSSVELRGVDICSYDLITLFSHRSCLSKLFLQDVYLTPKSQMWTDVLDHLCAVSKARSLEAGAVESESKAKPTRSTEHIQIVLDHVFEPCDEELHGGLTVKAEDLLGFFEGREGNPLRLSYGRFLCRDEG